MIITIITVATLTAAGAVTPLLRRASRHANHLSALLLVIAGAYIASNDLRLALISHGTLLSSRLPLLTATGAGAIVAAWQSHAISATTPSGLALPDNTLCDEQLRASHQRQRGDLPGDRDDDRNRD